jgi:hypothetical protein
VACQAEAMTDQKRLVLDARKSSKEKQDREKHTVTPFDLPVMDVPHLRSGDTKLLQVSTLMPAP